MVNLKAALSAGDVLFGPFSVSGSAAMVESIGYAGFDFVIIDTQHAPTSPFGSELEALIRAAWSADIAPIVRTTWNDRGQILKAVDMGASAVIVPQVNTAEEAAEAVSAAHFPPAGRRSGAPPVLGAKRGFIDWPTYYRRGISDVLVIALIEEYAGVENIEEIAAVEGLGGVFFGPFDLAVSMGLGESTLEPDLSGERERVYTAAKKHGLPIADISWPSEELPSDVPSALEKVKLGAQLIALGADVTMFVNACKSLARDVQGMKSDLKKAEVARD